ncbi:hypothetical protein KEM52_000461 [Ascosphaera acerosa]|nr:hypothetical protein KEM52_000461 [Ascosphaera acerosa]
MAYLPVNPIVSEVIPSTQPTLPPLAPEPSGPVRVTMSPVFRFVHFGLTVATMVLCLLIPIHDLRPLLEFASDRATCTTIAVSLLVLCYELMEWGILAIRWAYFTYTDKAESCREARGAPTLRPGQQIPQKRRPKSAYRRSALYYALVKHVLILLALLPLVVVFLVLHTEPALLNGGKLRIWTCRAIADDTIKIAPTTAAASDESVSLEPGAGARKLCRDSRMVFAFLCGAVAVQVARVVTDAVQVKTARRLRDKGVLRQLPGVQGYTYVQVQA